MIASYTGSDIDGNQIAGDHRIADFQPFQGRAEVVALGEIIAAAYGLTEVRVLYLRSDG